MRSNRVVSNEYGSQIENDVVSDPNVAFVVPDSVNEASFVTLIYLALVANLGAFLFGYDFGAMSWALTIFEDYDGNDDSYKYFGIIDNNDALRGLIASGSSIGAMTGYLMLLLYGNDLSKRNEIWSCACLYFIGAFLESMAATLKWNDWFPIAMMMVGRIFYGFGIAFALHSVPAYVSVASPSKYRGVFGAATESMGSLGVVVSYIVGFFCDSDEGLIVIFRIAYLIAAAYLALALALPQSPLYLVEAGAADIEVLESLRFVYPNAGRAQVIEIKENFEQVKRERRRWERKTGTQEVKGCCRPKNFFQSLPSPVRVLLSDRSLLQCLYLSLVLTSLAQLTGPSPILYYAHDVFKFICPNHPNLCISGLGGSKVLGSCSMLFLADSFGRRDILLFGVAIMAIGLFMVSFGALIFDFAAIIGVFISVIGYESSLGVMLWILLSELFPAYVRPAANSIAVFNLFFWSTVITFAFPFLEDSILITGVFLIFALAACVIWIVIYAYCPDTRGVDLEASYKLVKGTCNQTNAACCGIMHMDDEEEDEANNYVSEDDDDKYQNSEQAELLRRKKIVEPNTQI